MKYGGRAWLEGRLIGKQGRLCVRFSRREFGVHLCLGFGDGEMEFGEGCSQWPPTRVGCELWVDVCSLFYFELVVSYGFLVGYGR